MTAHDKQPADDEVQQNTEFLTTELAEARREITRLRAVIANVARERDEINHNLISLTAKSDRDRKQLRHLRRSLSWRITYPLRVFRRGVRDGAAARKAAR